MKKILSAVILVLSAGACVSELVAVEDMTTAKTHRGQTKSTFSFEKSDSLWLIHKRQTDSELRMLDMIYYRDSTYRIVIKEEESEELGIPCDIYRKYEALVTSFNNHSKENRHE